MTADLTTTAVPAFCVTEPSTLWVAGKAFPWAQTKREDLPEPHTFKTRQALLPFENGWTVSIVWGSCTYSSNHDHGIPGGPAFTETPTTVEVGILDRSGALLDLDVLGYLAPEQVLAVIEAVAAWPTDQPAELRSILAD